MRLLYFAWVKEKAGIAAEDIEPPEERDHHRRADRLAESARAGIRQCVRARPR